MVKENRQMFHHNLLSATIAMALESAIIRRVESLVHHPAFAGSDTAMDLVLEDLESMAESGKIPRATYQRLREMILRSPHFAGDN